MSGAAIDERPRPPSVDRVLRTDAASLGVARFGHQATANAIRAVLAALRDEGASASVLQPDAVGREVLARLERADMPSVRPVFNLTGTVLHTNLGRALLADAAIEAAAQAMRSAIALEFDLATGRRGERDDHVRGLVAEITGAESATFVNNNAAAVLLALNEIGAGREAIVSRGELIEIGGAFRLPDIMQRAGVRLVEVGTTNRTHRRDFEAAITDNTALILKAHTSNYVIQGFTASVAETELASLAKARGIVFINDLGSGTLVDLARYGLRPEPTVQQALQAGADLVTFSGDKLLGGPQCGIIAGRRDLVQRIAKNPMKRALRLDKIRLAALEATLKLYRDPDRLPATLPTLRAFVRSRSELLATAERLAGAIGHALGADYAVTAGPCESQIGSGALPLETLPSAGLAVRPSGKKDAGRRLETLVAAFRSLPVPVIGRVSEGELVLDLRCLEDQDAFLRQLPQLRVVGGGGHA